MANEPAGEHCAAGGQRISTGVDSNSNAKLDDNEILHTKYVCNGESPVVHQTLIRTEPEAVGGYCANGGLKLLLGLDKNSNAKLDDNEVGETSYICNGESVQGNSSLIRISEEPAGNNCPVGGKKIHTGVDNNGNGKLDNDEIIDTDYICNGLKGEGANPPVSEPKSFIRITTSAPKATHLACPDNASNQMTHTSKFYTVEQGAAGNAYKTCMTEYCEISIENGTQRKVLTTGDCEAKDITTISCNLGYDWQNGACVYTPPEPQCDSNNLLLCKEELSCNAHNGLWYDQQCQPSCPEGKIANGNQCVDPSDDIVIDEGNFENDYVCEGDGGEGSGALGEFMFFNKIENATGMNNYTDFWGTSVSVNYPLANDSLTIKGVARDAVIQSVKLIAGEGTAVRKSDKEFCVHGLMFAENPDNSKPDFSLEINGKANALNIAIPGKTIKNAYAMQVRNFDEEHALNRWVSDLASAILEEQINSTLNSKVMLNDCAGFSTFVTDSCEIEFKEINPRPLLTASKLEVSDYSVSVLGSLYGGQKFSSAWQLRFQMELKDASYQSPLTMRAQATSFDAAGVVIGINDIVMDYSNLAIGLIVNVGITEQGQFVIQISRSGYDDMSNSYRPSKSLKIDIDISDYALINCTPTGSATCISEDLNPRHALSGVFEDQLGRALGYAVEQLYYYFDTDHYYSDYDYQPIEGDYQPLIKDELSAEFTVLADSGFVSVDSVYKVNDSSISRPAIGTHFAEDAMESEVNNKQFNNTSDVTFAVSSNYINQMLLAKYQLVPMLNIPTTLRQLGLADSTLVRDSGGLVQADDAVMVNIDMATPPFIRFKNSSAELIINDVTITATLPETRDCTDNQPAGIPYCLKNVAENLNSEGKPFVKVTYDFSQSVKFMDNGELISFGAATVLNLAKAEGTSVPMANFSFRDIHPALFEGQLAEFDIIKSMGGGTHTSTVFPAIGGAHPYIVSANRVLDGFFCKKQDGLTTGEIIPRTLAISIDSVVFDTPKTNNESTNIIIAASLIDKNSPPPNSQGSNLIDFDFVYQGCR